MTKSSPRFDTYLVNVKLTAKIWSIFVVFLENMNFINAASEIILPHCGTYTEKGWGILTAAIQGEGEKMIYQQEGNIKA